MSKEAWRLYRTDRKAFVALLEEADGPEWPKYVTSGLGQFFRVDSDGFLWCTTG